MFSWDLTFWSQIMVAYLLQNSTIDFHVFPYIDLNAIKNSPFNFQQSCSAILDSHLCSTIHIYVQGLTF